MDKTKDTSAPLTHEQLQEFEDVVKKFLNPNATNSQLDSSISNFFNYFQSALTKIETAEDKDKATDEVSEDAVKKFVAWAQPYVDDWTAQQEQKEKEVEQKESSES